MKNKAILLLAMSLVLTLCGDGGEETASNVVIDDAECLSTTEIEQINKNIIENGIQLGELKSRDGNTATPEELMTEIEILRNELSSNDGVGENEDNLNKTILRLEEKLGITYEEVDFDNFGQDSILEELYDGTINPLESKDSLTAEEQDQLNLARDKAGLLDATLNRYILKKGNSPRILEIEERILELEGQIENFSPSSQTVEEIEDYIAAQEIILSTTPPCSDLVLSASESDEENESVTGLQDLKIAKEKLEKVRESIVNGEITFAEAAREASDEEETKFDGGQLRNPETQDYNFELTKMDPELYSQIQNLKDNEVSPVLKDQDRIHPVKFKILTVTARVDEHEANFATDYIKIQALALQNKKLKEIEKWQNTKIDDTYIKIANEYKGCEFFSNWLKQ